MKTLSKLLLKTACLTALCTTAYALDVQGTTNTNEQPSMTATNHQTPSEVFLEKNKLKPGVVTLPDGLQYKIVKEGTGDQPSDTDTVSVHYTGTLVDGTEFDSSYKHGGPATFPVNAVIPGWTEALKLMKVGSTWKLYIPANLAYGDRGAPPVIGPNQALIFKVELLGINP
jgi:FKBP-type peptidyl-prolyl cis-trans isomerase FklB